MLGRAVGGNLLLLYVHGAVAVSDTQVGQSFDWRPPETTYPTGNENQTPHVKVALSVILLSVFQMSLFIEAIRATVGVYSSREGVGSNLLVSL